MLCVPVKEYVMLRADAQVLSYDVHVLSDIAAVDVGSASCWLIQSSQYRPTSTVGKKDKVSLKSQGN